MDHGTIYLILVSVFGLFMAWGIGANDVANAMGTSVGSGALTIKKAFIIAAIFEFSGAFLAGGEVTKTIRKGIIDGSTLINSPDILVLGMLASLLAAGLWLLIASRFGWPVSTTHSIVGAIVGFAIVGVGVDAVNWSKIGQIVLSWLVTPLLAAVLSFGVFRSIQKLIFDKDNPFQSAQKFIPYYVFVVILVIALVTILKGLKHIGLDLNTGQSYLLSLMLAILGFIFSKIAVNRIKIDSSADKQFYYSSVEKIFGILMVITASAMAFAHGSNDVANAVGPVAAVFSIVGNDGEISSASKVPIYILLLGGVGIVFGLITYGHKIMLTIGKNITELTPSRGFAAELSAASTVVIASGTGLPVSTTQTLVGAVLGVGFARGIAALNTGVIRNIFMSWIVTLPAGALFAIIFFFILKAIF